MKEIIKPIFNYDGYFISNLGKVYCNIGKGGKILIEKNCMK